MQSKWLMITAAALAAWPAGLGAQQPPTPAPPAPPAAPAPSVRAAPRHAPARVWAFAAGENRGRIGVVVRTDASAETDKLGAKVEGVTPGGPADKAGLKVGDVITKFNGTALAGIPAEDEEESGPGRKLIELARKLAPGDTVRVEYRRGGDTKKATLVAEDLGFSFNFEMPHIPDMAPMAEIPMPLLDRMTVCVGEVWCDFELVTLNPELGEYFGTKDGLLVVKAPEDSSLLLKGGDVILSIGGRKPTSPSHAMRILRSYDASETVTIDIMRKQKRMTLSWTVPARDRHLLHRHGEREEQSRWRRPWRRLGRSVQRV